jgi:hypothetical protein
MYYRPTTFFKERKKERKKDRQKERVERKKESASSSFLKED